MSLTDKMSMVIGVAEMGCSYPQLFLKHKVGFFNQKKSDENIVFYSFMADNLKDREKYRKIPLCRLASKATIYTRVKTSALGLGSKIVKREILFDSFLFDFSIRKRRLVGVIITCGTNTHGIRKRFDEGKNKVLKPCTTYLLDQDYNSGCLFKTEGPTLAISIRNSNGSEELFSKNLKADFYIKPSPPENVTFFWEEDTVTVSCNKPKRNAWCLTLELQYKSKFDKEWQDHRSQKSDAQGDWIDRNEEDGGKETKGKHSQVQMSILPAIPDPKYPFADLFNYHNGNLQEWLDKNGHVVLQTKLEYEEPESITEAESQQEDGKNSEKQGPFEKIFTFPGAAENNDGKAPEIACLIPASNTTAPFAGFHMLMNDDMYVML
ncbi:Cytokine receptor-like factor 2 [Lonchura striata]|uniref:Cytokine receptor-like factor 2 n=1 Tax=Lonchura striata TaxID=40157 RepID=A0A218V493_9PASE|nr:Cytokine receptor-like factor 2 [Lonchura striata domestica]